MKKLTIILLSLIALSLTFSSCEKDEEDKIEIKDDEKIKEEEEKDTTTSKIGTIRLKIDNGFEGELLSTETEYIIESGDTIQVSMMRYYISNVYLTKENGDTVKIPNSYYLIDTEGKEIEIKDIPTDTYTGLCFGLGVDKDANHDIARNDGDLDPSGADGMIWNWNSGYKFIRIEGDYKGDTSSGSFKFHVGTDVNYKTIRFGENMSNMRTSTDGDHMNMFRAVISEGKTTEIHLRSNLAEAFKTPNTIDLDTESQAHGASTKVADNYAEKFFDIHHIEVQ